MTETRPVPKSQLPFTVEPQGRFTFLVYYTARHDGAKMPFRVQVEEGATNSLGIRILELMRMFWDKEAEVNGLLKKAEDLEIELGQAKQEILSLKGTINNAKGKQSK